jgi:LmbE family N-acetylglucosaminyl deacetylase
MTFFQKCIVTITVCGISCIGFISLSFKEPPQIKQKTLLAIFPHPDDESAIAEVLVKYAALGYKVQLMITTDGKNGTRVTKIPAGDSLGNLRKDETRCACKKMGIAEPIFLGIERLDTKIGVGKYFEEHKKLLQLLKEQIPLINPEFILTFGPDGDTHHAEHIVTGAAVTELFLREGWVDKYPLYYVAWTKDQGKTLDLGYVNEQYFNVKIEYTQEEENKALEIMPCYVTQQTSEEINEDRQKKLNDQLNVIYFRRFHVRKGMQKGF